LLKHDVEWGDTPISSASLAPNFFLSDCNAQSACATLCWKKNYKNSSMYFPRWV